MTRTFFDEMHGANGVCRPHYREFARWLADTPAELLAQRRREADLLFHRAGITFTLYGDDQGTERLIPFDIIPRSIPSSEWRIVEQGCIQRVKALNLFLADLYHDQRIIKAGIIPAEQVLANDQYQLAMQGLDLHRGLYSHISGIDLVRDGDGSYYVLEDNLRTPSGVSYMLEDRKMMMRLFPELFAAQRIAPIDHYPNLLLDTLKSASPLENPSVVVLTPGRFNSAYFEHAFLAREMGVELVEGADLFVRDDHVFMRTTAGARPVEVIYRRLDDAFLDPLAFQPDSMLGVPGLLSAYRCGNVVLANAIGTGVADDKSVYPFVTDMIRFYLDEEPILKNVPTWQCRNPAELSHVLAHLPELVVKETQGSGGYGMLVGPAASKAEIEAFRARLKANPAAYIAQPTLCLSTCPTFVDNGIAPRHIDLRPFVLSGREVRLVPGGLTRVALRDGSLVVNSSQGGGTKDTWVVEDGIC
ncbi:MAG: circularly permuted type 2 ATP-grasp protein [Pseudomonadota bacterium]